MILVVVFIVVEVEVVGVVVILFVVGLVEEVVTFCVLLVVEVVVRFALPTAPFKLITGIFLCDSILGIFNPRRVNASSGVYAENSFKPWV